MEEEAQEIGLILRHYCEWTGQAINWSKSSIHFACNVNSQTPGKLVQLLGMKECDHFGKYLGLPFCKLKSKNDAFKEIIEKLSNKLASWKRKSLSLARRITLIKSMSQLLPTYIMQTLLIPKGVCEHNGQVS